MTIWCTYWSYYITACLVCVYCKSLPTIPQGSAGKLSIYCNYFQKKLCHVRGVVSTCCPDNVIHWWYHVLCVCMLHCPCICIVVWCVVMATGVCSTSCSLWGIVWTFSDCCHGNIDRLSSQVMGKKQRWNILLLWYVTFICFLWWDCTYHIITYYILHITYYILHMYTSLFTITMAVNNLLLFSYQCCNQQKKRSQWRPSCCCSTSSCQSE